MSAAEICEVCHRHPWDGHKLDCPKRLTLSTPPADDVREALTSRLERSFGPFLAHWPHNPDRFFGGAADEVMAAFEVRPHGTVTNTEPQAWAVYGKKTGTLRYVVWHADEATELNKHYNVLPLYLSPHGTVTDADRAAINGALIESLPIWVGATEEGHARKALLEGIVGALEAAREVQP